VAGLPTSTIWSRPEPVPPSKLIVRPPAAPTRPLELSRVSVSRPAKPLTLTELSANSDTLLNVLPPLSLICRTLLLPGIRRSTNWSLLLVPITVAGPKVPGVGSVIDGRARVSRHSSPGRKPARAAGPGRTGRFFQPAHRECSNCDMTSLLAGEPPWPGR